MRPDQDPSFWQRLKDAGGRATGVAAAVVVLSVVPAEAALADDTYPGGNPPELPPVDNPPESETPPEEEIPHEVFTGRPGVTEEAQGGLPVTGGDIVGLTAMGLAALATGAVAVRHSRRTAP